MQTTHNIKNVEPLKLKSDLFQLAGVLIVLALLQIILSGISFAASNNEDILVEAKKKIDDNLQKYDDPHSKYKEVQHNLEEKVINNKCVVNWSSMASFCNKLLHNLFSLQYHCCGSNNYTDYKNIEIPKSCCVVPSEPCALKQKGCGDAVAEKIVFLHKTVGAVATILYLLEVSFSYSNRIFFLLRSCC